MSRNAFETCPVCHEKSDQCLSCASYVVNGERIYYGKLINFGASNDSEVRFIRYIQKYSVKAFFHNGELYIPSRQGRSVPLAIGLQWGAWQEQQKRIDRAIILLKSLKSENDLWGCDQVDVQIDLLEKVLKGGDE